MEELIFIEILEKTDRVEKGLHKTLEKYKQINYYSNCNNY